MKHHVPGKIREKVERVGKKSATGKIARENVTFAKRRGKVTSEKKR